MTILGRKLHGYIYFMCSGTHVCVHGESSVLVHIFVCVHEELCVVVRMCVYVHEESYVECTSVCM